MTRIIDIEARAMERDTYRPLFRLTDIDRRRERKVVRMPNDGPGMTWDERMALSEARLSKLVKPKRGEEHIGDSMVNDYAMGRVLTCIKRGIITQQTIAAELQLAISTIASRCAEACRRGYITARRDRVLYSKTFYRLTEDGERFLAANPVRKPVDHETKAEKKATNIPPSPLRDSILAYLCSGEWRTASQIAKAINKDSNHVSAAARRGVDYGHVEMRGAGGIGSIASYRITDEGRAYLKTGRA